MMNRNIKKAAAFLIGILLTGAFSLHAVADDFLIPDVGGGGIVSVPVTQPVPEDFDYTNSIVTGFADSYLFNGAVVIEVTAGDDMSSIYAQTQPLCAYASIYKDGMIYVARLGIDWDYTQVDLSKEGQCPVYGSVRLPSGCTLAQGLSCDILFWVEVQAEADYEHLITAIEPLIYQKAFAVKTGTTAQELMAQLAAYRTAVSVTLDNGDTETLPVEWDVTDVDTSQTGSYTARATPVLPEGIGMAPSCETYASCMISVQEESFPEINTCYYRSDTIIFVWVSMPENAQIVLQTGETQQDITESPLLSMAADGLYLEPSLFCNWTSYELILTTDTFESRVEFFFDEGKILLFGYSFGDRDGGSGGINQLPGIIQPDVSADVTDNAGSTTTGTVSGGINVNTTTTAAPAEAEAESAADGSEAVEAAGQVAQSADVVSEEDSASSSTYSGKRLKFLCTLKNMVTFDKNGVLVAFMSESLLKLALADTDLFFVEITRPDQNSVNVVVKINGEDRADFGNISVNMPFEGSMQDYTLTAPDGEQISAAYSGNMLSFTSDKAGCFTVNTEQDASSGTVSLLSGTTGTTYTGSIVFVAVLGGLIFVLLIGVGVWLWQRRKMSFGR